MVVVVLVDNPNEVPEVGTVGARDWSAFLAGAVSVVPRPLIVELFILVIGVMAARATMPGTAFCLVCSSSRLVQTDVELMPFYCHSRHILTRQ
jgi:hypothetical protein